jgi:hypothetical protein
MADKMMIADTIWLMIIFALSIASNCVIIIFSIPENEMRYNCNMLIGGWHPDVPVKVAEECRKARRP